MQGQHEATWSPIGEEQLGRGSHPWGCVFFVGWGGTNENLKKAVEIICFLEEKSLKIPMGRTAYLPTWNGGFFMVKLVGKYTSPMDPQGNVGAANHKNM